VAVDTGGTKTAAWLVDATDPSAHRLLGQARTSAGNPLGVGFEQSTLAIRDAITQARQSASVPTEGAAYAILSIAGAANRDMTRKFIAWGQSIGLARKIAIVSDVLPILAAGTPDCCGVALISGTGSSAYGRAANGPAKRCGGWGFLMGDEGSGYAIGRAALQHTLRNLEAGATGTGLADAIARKLNAKSVTELTRAVYSDNDPRHAIAAFAPQVCAAAENGDPEACKILDAAAVDLAELAARTAHAVGVADSGFPLAVSGGVLMSSPRLQNQLKSELASRNLDCAVTVVREPLEGCVRLADARFADVLVTWHS
jgi:glucosamine kinase